MFLLSLYTVCVCRAVLNDTLLCFICSQQMSFSAKMHQILPLPKNATPERVYRGRAGERPPPVAVP